ncbi:PASTA domain containing protein [uncultured Paludibacter sp.]|uniref:PASTA domain containing protein n=1 Tax=uncultured Paludibacter sp. TaxID=497635 RepID=A0A653AH53_9BACT|nr:PASTA domain containing protein [uncultured Paludibacter sp.]
MTKDNKSFWNDNFLGFALKNILIALAIIVGLAWGTFILISIYTNHGKTEQVPNLKGLTTEKAQMLLDNHNLKMEIIDSVYTKDAPLGSIIEQNPFPQSIVKSGRSVYLIVNSKRVRQVTIPSLVDISLRQAEAMLTSMGIQIGRVSYAPSDYKDLILDIQYKGKSISAGTKLPEGSSVVLIAGNGYGGEKSSVPTLKGMDLNAAMNAIKTAAYTVGGIIYDEEPMGDEDQYYVYKQRPIPGDSLSTGERVDIWLSKDKNKKDDTAIIRAAEKAKIKQEEKEKTKDIEDFF